MASPSSSSSLPPPPPSVPRHRGNPSSDYYYLVATVAMIAAMLIVSNIFAFVCCSPCPFGQSFRNWLVSPRSRGGVAGCRSEEMIPATRYEKERAYGTECSICLTGFAEGEEVRQLPGCKHSFHAPCIYMWLFSHSSCPLCRGTVDGLLPPPPLPRCPMAGVARPLFSESASLGHVAVYIV